MTQKNVVALAVLLLALVGLVGWLRFNSVSSRQVEGRGDRLLPAFSKKTVKAVEVTSDGVVMSFYEHSPASEDELTAAVWKMKSPVAADVEESVWDAALGALEWTSAKRTLHDVSDADLALFGLKSPRVRVAFKVGQVRQTVAIGADAPRSEGVYARVGQDRSVHVVPAELLNALHHGVFEFRRKSLVQGYDVTAVTELRLRSQAFAERVFKQVDARWMLSGTNAARAQDSVVEDALRVFAEARVVHFVAEEAKNLPSLGLQPAALEAVVTWDASLSVGGESKKRTERVRVGGPCGADTLSVHVLVGDSGPLMCVAKTAFDSWNRSEHDFVEKRLLLTADEKIKTLVYAPVSGAAHTLVREADRWTLKIAGDRDVAVDESAVTEWLEALRTTEALPSAAVAGADTALATFSVEGADGANKEVLHLSRVANQLLIRRNDDMAVLALSAEFVALLAPDALRLRERELLNLDDETAIGIRVERRGLPPEEATSREGEWTLAAGAAADRGFSRELVRRVSSATALRFAAPQAKPEHGLTEPRAVVAVRYRSANGETTHVLRLGAEGADGVFATLDDDPAVFVVSRETAEVVDSSLVDRRLLPSATQALRELQWAHGSNLIKWRLSEDEPMQPLVSDALLAFRAVRCLADAPRASLGKATATLRLHSSSGAADTLSFYGGVQREGEAFYFAKDKRGVICEVTARAFEGLEATLGELRDRP